MFNVHVHYSSSHWDSFPNGMKWGECRNQCRCYNWKCIAIWKQKGNTQDRNDGYDINNSKGNCCSSGSSSIKLIKSHLHELPKQHCLLVSQKSVQNYRKGKTVAIASWLKILDRVKITIKSIDFDEIYKNNDTNEGILNTHTEKSWNFLL